VKEDTKTTNADIQKPVKSLDGKTQRRGTLYCSVVDEMWGSQLGLYQLLSSDAVKDLVFGPFYRIGAKSDLEISSKKCVFFPLI